MTDNTPETFAIDFETTGIDVATAHPIEMAVVSTRAGGAYCTLIRLPEGEAVPPETSAVHHIIDDDLLDAPGLDDVAGFTRHIYEDQILVAHNADYEKGILAKMWPGAEPRFVCTFKVALLLFPDAPSHSNEALRYWLKLGDDRGRSRDQKSHSALHDAIVTATLFEHMVGVWLGRDPVGFPATRAGAIDWMVRVSRETAVLPKCPIGKERGKLWEDIDAGYLSWCLKQNDMREDVKAACRRELDRRARR